MILTNPPLQRTADDPLRDDALDGGPAAATLWLRLGCGIMQRKRGRTRRKVSEGQPFEPKEQRRGDTRSLGRSEFEGRKPIKALGRYPIRPAAICGAAKVLHALPGRRSRVRPRIFISPTRLARDTDIAVWFFNLAGVRCLLRRTLISLSLPSSASWVHESLRRAFIPWEAQWQSARLCVCKRHD